MTLLGGRNNVGKTSVLEAFFLSRDWGNAEMLTRHLAWRGLDSYVTNAESAWAPAFSDFSLTNKRIQVRTRDPEGDRETFTAQIVDAPTRTTRPASSGSTSTAQNIRAPGEPSLRLTFTKGSRTIFEAQVTIAQGSPPYVLNPSIIEGKPQIVRYVLARQRTSSAEDATNFGKLDTEKRTGELVDYLKMIDPQIGALSVVPVGMAGQIFVDVKDIPKKVPVNLMGDGITRLLSMLLHIANSTGGYVIVDEIETAFHHSTMPDVWRSLYQMCRTNKIQLIATTHSYECVSAFVSSLKDVAGDEFAYVRLDKKDKSIEAVTYDSTSLANATEGGWEVR